MCAHRATDPEFEGHWTPEEEYLDASLFRKYSRALYFSLVITYGNDLSECGRFQEAFGVPQSQGELNRLREVELCVQGRHQVGGETLP